MSWELKRNVTKIFNAFKRNKERIYKEDIDALKNIDEFINESSKQLTKDNLIYAKVLAINLRQNLHYYQSMNTSIKSLQNELKLPLNYQLEMLTKELNNITLLNYFRDKGVNFDEMFFDKSLASKEQKEVTEKILSSWTKEQVEKSFYNSANDLLKEIENYS